MADDIKTIVERMVKAGEPEENIALVIQHAKTQGMKAAPDVTVTPVSDKEPGTWWGGFVNHIASALANNPMLQAAAHPQDASDMASLLIPEEAATRLASKVVEPVATPVIRGIKSMGRSAARGAAQLIEDVPTLKKVTPGAEAVVRGLKKIGTEPPPEWLDRFKPNRGGTPDTGIPQGDLPTSSLSEVDHHMPNVSGVPDEGIPQEEMPTATPPVDVESALETLVRKQLGDTSAPATQTDRVPYGGVEVPHRVKKPRMASNVANPFGKDDAAYGSMMERLGKEPLSDEAMANPVGAGPIPEPDVTVTPKPKLSVAEVAQMLRGQYGSRDASKMLYGSGGDTLPRAAAKENITRLAPGPSKVPTAAQERIDAFNMKQRMGEDEDPIAKVLIGTILSGLSGKMLAHSQDQ